MRAPSTETGRAVEERRVLGGGGRRGEQSVARGECMWAKNLGRRREHGSVAYMTLRAVGVNSDGGKLCVQEASGVGSRWWEEKRAFK